MFSNAPLFPLGWGLIAVLVLAFAGIVSVVFSVAYVLMMLI